MLARHDWSSIQLKLQVEARQSLSTDFQQDHVLPKTEGVITPQSPSGHLLLLKDFRPIYIDAEDEMG
jgi:hypothetical protein